MSSGRADLSGAPRGRVSERMRRVKLGEAGICDPHRPRSSNVAPEIDLTPLSDYLENLIERWLVGPSKKVQDHALESRLAEPSW